MYLPKTLYMVFNVLILHKPTNTTISLTIKRIIDIL